MTKLLDTLLLLALPASGKSEVRKYLDGLSPEQCREEFHTGRTVQLDDYPYVHFMHRIDDELFKRGQPYVFYKAIKLGYKVCEVPVTNIYPPKHLGYTKMKPITGWWSILRPLLYLALKIKK